MKKQAILSEYYNERLNSIIKRWEDYDELIYNDKIQINTCKYDDCDIPVSGRQKYCFKHRVQVRLKLKQQYIKKHRAKKCQII
jgi:hypothetical protein